MHKLFTCLGFAFLAGFPALAQDKPSLPPAIPAREPISMNRGMPEEFFAELGKILNGMEKTAPLLGVERQREKEAQARKIVSDGRQGWRAGLGLSAYSLHENREGGSYDDRFRFLASANAKRPIYHWGALQAESRIARLGILDARSSYAETHRQLVSTIRSSYLELVLRGYALELAKDSLSLAQENQETANRKHELGLLTAVDVSETKIATLRQRIRIFELEREIRAETQLFAHETGWKQELNFAIPESFRRFVTGFGSTRPAVPVGGAIRSGALESLDHAIAMESERVIVAEAIRKPKVNLVGSLYQDQVDALDSTKTLDRTNLVVGVQVQWDLFDGGESEGRKSEALSRKRRFQMQRDYEKERLVLRRNRLLHDLETRAELVQSRQELAAVSNEKFEKSRIEFDQNRITVEDFFAYRLELDQSKLDLMGSVVDYLGLLGEYLILHGEGKSTP